MGIVHQTSTLITLVSGCKGDIFQSKNVCSFYNLMYAQAKRFPLSIHLISGALNRGRWGEILNGAVPDSSGRGRSSHYESK